MAATESEPQDREGPEERLHHYVVESVLSQKTAELKKLANPQIFDSMVGIVRHLREKERILVEELEAIRSLLGGLHKEIAALRFVGNEEEDVSSPYSGMTVRAAILTFLMESERALSSSEIAKALKAGGVKTKGRNFHSNVSAVLSQMMGTLEVARNGAGFLISELGKERYEAVRSGKLSVKRSALEK